MYLILQTLLTLIHIIYKLISFIHYYYSFVSLKVKTQIWNRCLLRTTDLCILKKNSRFKKIPNHLVIIINEEKQTIQNIHQLLNWSTAIGIPYISFYDCQGNIFVQIFIMVSLHLLSHRLCKGYSRCYSNPI